MNPTETTLSELERDAVTELANIGVSRAAASLRKMVGHQVLLSVPSVDILTRKAAGALINERESDNLVAVQQAFSGPFAGRALLIFPETNSLQLIRAIIGTEDMPESEVEELEEEALTETGNVILNGCLGTIANMLRQSLTMSLPTVLRGSGSQLFQSKDELDGEGLVLFLYINFSVRDRDIRGYIAMLMDLPALAAMRVLIGEFIGRYLPPTTTVPIDASASLDELRRLAGPLFASIEHSGVPVAVTDPRLPDNPFVFANAAFAQLTGYEFAEIVGKSWRTLQGPESDRETVQKIEQAVSDGRQIKTDLLNHRKDGTVFRNNVFISPIPGADGRPAFFLSTHDNVTAAQKPEIIVETRRKRREEVADRLRATLSLSGGAAAWEWQIDEGRILGDARFADLYGLNSEDASEGISADRFYSIIHPDDQTRIRLAIDGMLQGAEVFSKEYRIILSNGSLRWVHARGYCITEHDRPIRFTGVLVDTTEQKRVEEQLRIAQTAGGIGTFEHIDGFATAKVSPQFCNLLGLHPAHDLPVRTINALVHPDDPPLINVQPGPKVGAANHVEFRITRPDNDAVHWLTRRGEYLHDAETAGLRFSGVIYDITNSKRIEEQLRILNENLEANVRERTQTLARAEEQLRQSQKMEAIGQLTGGIAHDFNNMLTGITASLDLIRHRVKAGRSDDLERYLDAASTSAQRAATLTHSLLAFARRQSLDIAPKDVNTLVESLQDILRRALGESISLVTNLAPDLWPALTDTNQLESALLNLALNARDAMPKGGRLTLQTTNARLERTSADSDEVKPGDYVLISVTDTGSGMSPDVIAKAFDPFFTTKPIGQGTGLGLSILYGFVKQSGGNVRIDSQLGMGTTIGIYLPRASHGEVTVAPPAKLNTPRGRGETVLIVEDDQTVRLLVTQVLTELGYRYLEASDASSAVRHLRSSEQIDLLITDVGLPHVDGRQLADVARQHRPDLRVLFITGYTAKAALRNGFLGPGMELLSKPFALDALGDKIRNLLER